MIGNRKITRAAMPRYIIALQLSRNENLFCENFHKLTISITPNRIKYFKRRLSYYLSTNMNLRNIVVKSTMNMEENNKRCLSVQNV